MPRLLLVCGPVGAGKTTYTNTLAKEINAVKFSIDPWMQTLFANDMTSLDYGWMIERVNRCYQQIWDVSQQILALNSNVILDLGFTTKAQRALFVERAATIGVEAELHYLDAPHNTRKHRIKQRNKEKDPSVYSFEVTDMMFNFMEPKFEVPDEVELSNGCKVNID